MPTTDMDAIDSFLADCGLAPSVESDAHNWIPGAGIRYARLQPASSALSLADQLREKFPTTGVWPLVVQADVDDLAEICDFREVVAGAEAVAQSWSLDPLMWLPSYITPEQIGLLENHSDDEILSALAQGPAPEAGLVLGGDWLGASMLLLVPCDQPWEVIARAGFGGWNDCPAPPFQAAFHRRLAATAGLEVRGIGRDKMLVYLSNPPRDPDAVLGVVRLLTRYCNDLSIAADEPEVARIVLAGPEYWGFWWD
jgi:Domain of unknown function (DUF4253)